MVTPWNADNKTNPLENEIRPAAPVARVLSAPQPNQYERLLGMALWMGFAGVLLWIGAA